MRESSPDPSRGSQLWRAQEGACGSRLDVYLADALGESRNQVQKWVKAGRVLLDGLAILRPSFRLEGGEEIECLAPEEGDEALLAAEDGELSILWEDQDIIVLDKPAPLAVHPGAGRPDHTLANRLLGRYPEIARVGHPRRPGIVHRLDIGTTGVMVAARHPEAHRALALAFSDRHVDKIYLALAYGSLAPPAGEIDSPIGRDPRHRTRMTVSPDGRPAMTHYRTLGAASGVSSLELDLKTGRTHQIRVHLRSLGHPLVGDPVYGEARWKGLPAPLRPSLRDFPRPALHAWRLTLDHPSTGESIRFEAPLPEDLRSLWESLGGGQLS